MIHTRTYEELYNLHVGLGLDFVFVFCLFRLGSQLSAVELFVQVLSAAGL